MAELKFLNSSAGLGLALDRSGWTMSAVKDQRHASHPAQMGELECMIVPTLRMWQSTVLVDLPLLAVGL